MDVGGIVSVEAGTAVAVSVDGISVCVALPDGVASVKVSGSAVEPEGLRQPANSSSNNGHTGRNLDMDLFVPLLK